MGRQVAEEATGIRQRGAIGAFYEEGFSDDPPAITPEVARALLEGSKRIAVPNAGAGSYKEFFGAMGFKAVKVIEGSSSAGDWTFGIQRNDDTWCVAFQENRYPRCGFIYSIDPRYAAASFEVLCNSLPQ